MGESKKPGKVVDVAVGTRETQLEGAFSRAYSETRKLAEAISTASATQDAGVVTNRSLQQLDRGLPRQTLGDLLLACEAYASMTGPSALAAGDLTTVRVEAERIISLLRPLARVSRSRRITDTTVQLPAVGLRTVLSDEHVIRSFNSLIAAFAELANVEGEQVRKRFAVRIGTRYLVPGSVLAATLALILFFVGGIAFATGAVTLSPQGVTFSNPLGSAANAANIARHGAPGSQGTPGGVGGTSATSTPGTGSGQAPSATPTSKPSPQPTATPVPSGGPALTVSPSSVQPCQGTDAQFAITYTSGSGSVTWTATSPDPSNIALSTNGNTFSQQVGGTLRQGQQVTVYVRLLNDTPITGQISVTGSNGVAPTSATYDSTGC